MACFSPRWVTSPESSPDKRKFRTRPAFSDGHVKHTADTTPKPTFSDGHIKHAADTTPKPAFSDCHSRLSSFPLSSTPPPPSQRHALMSSVSQDYMPTSSAAARHLKRVRSGRDQCGPMERSPVGIPEGDQNYGSAGMRRGASYREGGSRSPVGIPEEDLGYGPVRMMTVTSYREGGSRTPVDEGCYEVHHNTPNGKGMERSSSDVESGYSSVKMRRGASLREGGGSRTPTENVLPAGNSTPGGRSTPRARLDRAASCGDSRSFLRSCGSSPSPTLSPTSTSHSHTPHSSLPNFKAMSEADARLVFRSLVEAVHRSRWNSEEESTGAVNDSSILFGKCNEPCCRPVTFFAPEMVDTEREGVCDLDQLEIWSLGVLLYKMLTGKQPFEGKTDAKTLRLILACQVRFPLFSWQSMSLSGEVKTLIKWMLSYQPSDRPTISQVLQHPWVSPLPKKH